MKLLQTAHKFNTAIQNSSFLPYIIETRLRIFPNRVECSFYINDNKLPFLFRVGIDGNSPHFISIPHYLEYSRATCQLPDELKALVFDIRNIGVKRAENMFYIREYWKMAKRA